jgi:regulator of sigma E protease
MLAQPPIWLIVVAFVCAIGPLVFFHELGHYLVGRLFGVGAEIFSIGFGREIAGWADRSGTRWKIGWLPLGGYVRFVGDEHHAGEGEPEPMAGIKGDSFATKPVWQRFLIVLAGPMANFLLAILIFAAFFATLGAPRSNVVGAVESNSAAAVSGIRPGDKIVAIGGRPTPTFADVFNVVVVRPGEDVTVKIERNGETQVIPVHLGTGDLEDTGGTKFKRGLLGVSPNMQVQEPVSVFEAVPMAVSFTWGMTRSIVDGIWQLVRGRISPKQLGGPIKIAQVAGEGASQGPLTFVSLLALLSINLGFINLLPVPVLDGGHLLFYAIEAIRRRPVSAQAQEWAFRGGVALILALLLFTTMNDLGSFGVWGHLGRLIG